MTGTQEPRSVGWLSKLISFDTTSRDSNLPLIRHVAGELTALGLEPRIFPNDDGTKANLFVTVPAADGSTNGGVMLSGHTDVVPVDGQRWTSEPFTSEVRGGRLYGRGASDMKAFSAAVLALLPEFLDRKLDVPLHIALTCDEEVGCLGAVTLLEGITANGIKPDICFVGEPTSMRVIAAHKSSNLFRLVFTGVATHSSLTPSGVNAIEYAAKAINFIRFLADEHKANGPFNHDFDVPFTTASVGLINGGVAVNTVPDRCDVDFEFRTVPEDNPHDFLARVRGFAQDVLLPQMRAENLLAGVELHEVAMVPGLSDAGGTKALDLAQALTSSVTADKVAYATEAGIYQAAGIDTVICGPGSLEQAHTADEYIELAQIHACEQFLLALATDLETA
jgi:acetylornithine deacetylase